MLAAKLFAANGGFVTVNDGLAYVRARGAAN